MANLNIDGISIKGVTAALPKKEVFNADYPFLSDKEKARVIKTIGINSRRIANAAITAADLCYIAAEKLLSELNWNRAEISILLFVSQTPDFITPCTAAILQDRLDLPKSALCFDINLGCSAYPYGLATAMSLLKGISHGKALLLVGDKSSHLVSEMDKSTALIFSDAGSATALEHDGKGFGIRFSGYTDGSGSDTLMVKGGGCKYPFNKKSLKYTTVSEGIKRNELNLEMNGLNIFNFAIRQVLPTIKSLIESEKTSTDDIDYFVFHQANKIINESLRKMLKVSSEQMAMSLSDFGNTSSASIPVTMVHTLGGKLSIGEHTLLLSGFGVGLSWGNAIIKTESLPVIPIINV